MITPRREARRAAFQILYRFDVGKEPVPAAVHLAEQLKQHFDHFQVQERSREYAALLVSGVLLKQADLDQRIAEKAKGWTLQRMTPVDRSLLRLGAYELLHVDDVEPSITINEMIEISKEFGEKDSPSFINGILDAIHK